MTASPRGPRQRIAPGIYKDAIGYAAVVVVGSGDHRQQREHRFPLGTAMRTMTDWQTDTRAGFKKSAKRQAIRGSTSGTLAADVRRYVLLIPTDRRARRTRAEELAAWETAFGDRSTLKLAAADLVRVHQEWAASGAAPSTLNHRRNALIQLIATLYPEAENAARRIPHTTERKGDARNLDPRDVDDVLAAMPRSATRARLMVMAATGLSQARIKEVVPADINLIARTMRLAGRRKGEGTAGRVFPLSKRGVAAWREMARCRAWGPFANIGLSISLRRGIAKANAARAAKRQKGTKLIEICDFIPYQLRHTFGTELYRLTRDIRIVAELLDCSPETALRYTRGAVDSGMAAAVAALDGLAPTVGTR